MKRILLDRHFLLGTTYGLLLVFVMGYGLLQAALWSLVVMAPLSFLAAYVVPLSLARALDQPREAPPKFYYSVGGLLGLYFSGVTAGCFANFLVHGQWQTSPQFGWRSEIWSWFGKPFYALTIYGLPAALIVGVSFAVFTRILVGNPKRE